MKNHFVKEFLAIFLLFLMTLTPLLSYQNDKLLAAAEHSSWINLDFSSKGLLEAWSDKNDMPSMNATQIPVQGLWKVLRYFGLSEISAQKILVISFSFLMPFGMYYLYRTLNIGGGIMGAMFASFLYYFNIYVIVQAGLLLHQALFVFSMAPLIFGFVFNGALSHKIYRQLIFAFLISLCFLPLSVAAANPPLLFTVIVVPLLFFILQYKEYKQILRFLMIVIPMILFINMFWIYALYNYWEPVFNLVTNEMGTVGNLQKGNQVFDGKLYDSIRMLGSEAFKDDVGFPYNNSYYGGNFIVTAASYLVVFFASLSFLIAPSDVEKKKNLFFVGSILVVGLFLVKGVNMPFGQLYLYIFDSFSWAYMFRNPVSKFGLMVLVPMSILFGYAISKVLSKIKNKWNYILFLIFITGIVVSASYTRIFVSDTPKHYGYVYNIKKPAYWHEIASWLAENDSDAIILDIRKDPLIYLYKWGDSIASSSGRSFAHYLLPNKVLGYSSPRSSEKKIVNKLVNNPLVHHDKFNFVFDLIGAKYIIIQGDQISSDTYDIDIRYDLDTIAEHIEKNKKFIQFKKFGPLILYKRLDYVDRTFSVNKLNLYFSNVKNDIIDYEVFQYLKTNTEDQSSIMDYRKLNSSLYEATLDKGLDYYGVVLKKNLLTNMNHDWRMYRVSNDLSLYSTSDYYYEVSTYLVKQFVANLFNISLNSRLNELNNIPNIYINEVETLWTDEDDNFDSKISGLNHPTKLLLIYIPQLILYFLALLSLFSIIFISIVLILARYKKYTIQP